MMGLPAGVRIWLAAGVTDLRKGFEGLSALVQTSLGLSPYSPGRPPQIPPPVARSKSPT
jgi:transposase